MMLAYFPSSPMKHTPGPWTVTELKHSSNGYKASEFQIANKEERRCVAVTPKFNRGLRNYKEAEANARLIAAAPELLEDAKQALSLLEKWRVENKLPKTQIEYDLRHTIAKAEGSLSTAA